MKPATSRLVPSGPFVHLSPNLLPSDDDESDAFIDINLGNMLIAMQDEDALPSISISPAILPSIFPIRTAGSPISRSPVSISMTALPTLPGSILARMFNLS